MNKKSNIFYGWWIVLGCFTLLLTIYPPVINTVSVYTKPITEALGFGRAEYMLYFTIMALASMFGCPIVGNLIKKYDIRMIMTAGVILVSLSLIGFSCSSKLIHFYIFAIPEGLGLAATCLIPPGVLLTNWFKEKRGLAMGVALAGSGIGGAIISNFTVWLITTYSWRTAYVVIAIIILVLSIPFTTLVIRSTPEEKGLLPFGGNKAVSNKLVGLTQKETIRTLSFYLLCAAILIAGIVINGLLVNISPYLTDIGYSAKNAGLLLSISLLTMTLGKIIIGVSYDKFGLYITFFIVSLSSLLAVITLKSAVVLAFGIAYTILFGIAAANITVSPSFITATLFGNKDYSSNYGIIAIFTSLAGAIAPIVSGAIYSISNSYSSLLYGYMALSVLAYILLVLAAKTKPKFDTSVIDSKGVSNEEESI